MSVSVPWLPALQTRLRGGTILGPGEGHEPATAKPHGSDSAPGSEITIHDSRRSAVGDK